MDTVMVPNVVVLVVDSCTVLEARLTFCRWGPGAVTADINILASVFRKIECSVLFTRRVGKTGRVSVLVHALGVATVASSSEVAIDRNLSIETYRGMRVDSLSVIVDVESISDSRGGTLSPA